MSAHRSSFVPLDPHGYIGLGRFLLVAGSVGLIALAVFGAGFIVGRLS